MARPDGLLPELLRPAISKMTPGAGLAEREQRDGFAVAGFRSLERDFDVAFDGAAVVAAAPVPPAGQR